jgi:hypothetical protein
MELAIDKEPNAIAERQRRNREEARLIAKTSPRGERDFTVVI